MISIDVEKHLMKNSVFVHDKNSQQPDNSNFLKLIRPVPDTTHNSKRLDVFLLKLAPVEEWSVSQYPFDKCSGESNKGG